MALEFAVKHPNRVTQLALLDAKINRLQPTLKLSDCAHLTPFEQELVAEATDIDWEAEDQIGLKFLEAVAERRLAGIQTQVKNCLLYTSPSPRDRQKSRMPSSA